MSGETDLRRISFPAKDQPLREVVAELLGDAVIGSFIISMAQDVDDVLTVLWLARLGGEADLDITRMYTSLAAEGPAELFEVIRAEFDSGTPTSTR